MAKMHSFRVQCLSTNGFQSGPVYMMIDINKCCIGACLNLVDDYKNLLALVPMIQRTHRSITMTSESLEYWCWTSRFEKSFFSWSVVITIGHFILMMISKDFWQCQWSTGNDERAYSTALVCSWPTLCQFIAVDRTIIVWFASYRAVGTYITILTQHLVYFSMYWVPWRYDVWISEPMNRIHYQLSFESVCIGTLPLIQ